MRVVATVVERRPLGGLVHDCLCLPLELLDLGGDRAAAGLELQQHRFRGLAEEPHLPPRRVVADPVAGDGKGGLPQELVALDDDEFVDGFVDDHVEAPEAAGPGFVDEPKRRLHVGRDHGGAAAAEGRDDCTLVSGSDLQLGEEELVACFGERARRRRNPLALGECPLERREPLARETGLLAQLHAAQLSRRRARRKPGPGRCVAQRLDERRRALAPQRQPLARALEPVEGGCCRLAPAGGVGELFLRAVPLREQLLELGLGSPLRMAGRRSPLRRLADPLVDHCQVESRECRLERGDLSAELLRPLRCARLERERSQPLLHLCLDVPGPRDVLPDPRELQLRAVAASLELPETCRLLHERAPLLGLRGEDLLDLALRDDGARCAAEADVRQQLHEVGAPNGGPVDQVLPLAAPVQATHDGDFRRQGGQRVVLVVEHELHLAVGRRLAGSRP